MTSNYGAISRGLSELSDMIGDQAVAHVEGVVFHYVDAPVQDHLVRMVSELIDRFGSVDLWL